MVERLIQGLKRFRGETFQHYREHYQHLASEGQNPSTLFIGCSDSRLVPNLITDTGPGDMFVVRNVGAFVPPYESAEAYHGTTAAIEFATEVLNVTDIVICGHSDCGAIQSLYKAPNPDMPHVTNWLNLAEDAKLEGKVTPEMLRRTEERAIVLQVERLFSFPTVAKRVEAGALAVHGWHYDIGAGVVRMLDVQTGRFTAV